MTYDRPNARRRTQTRDRGGTSLPRRGFRGRDGGAAGDHRDHRPARPSRDGQRRPGHAARGGAILPAPIGHEPSYSEKARQAAAEKASIARLAVQMIRPGDSILLGPGTTTQALAKLL